MDNTANIVIFSDLQFDDYSSFDPIRDVSGATSRLNVCRDALSQVVSYCLSTNVKTVIFAGDLVDKKSYTSLTVLHFLSQSLSAFKAAGIQFIGIAGNHDFINKECTKSVPDLFLSSHILNFSFPQNLPLEIDGVPISLSLVPDVDNKVEAFKRVTEKVEYLGDLRFKLLVAHCSLVGGKMTEGATCDRGVNIVDTQFDKYDLCLFGDFHKHQQLNSNSWYIGALLQKTFGEEGNPQHFLHLQIKERNPIPVLNWIPLKGIPEFRTVTVKEAQELKKYGFNGYLKIRDSTVTDGKKLEKLSNEFKETCSKVLIEVPVKEKSSARLDFSKCGDNLVAQGKTYIDNRAAEDLDKDYLKELLAVYV